jgi:hypothetical protein
MMGGPCWEQALWAPHLCQAGMPCVHPVICPGSSCPPGHQHRDSRDSDGIFQGGWGDVTGDQERTLGSCSPPDLRKWGDRKLPFPPKQIRRRGLQNVPWIPGPQASPEGVRRGQECEEAGEPPGALRSLARVDSVVPAAGAGSGQSGSSGAMFGVVSTPEKDRDIIGWH